MKNSNIYASQKRRVLSLLLVLSLVLGCLPTITFADGLVYYISPAPFVDTTFVDGDIYFNIRNPYANVDWDTYHQFRANLHTHTRHSDGSATMRNTVFDFYNKGYDILAVTDHDMINNGWLEGGTIRETWAANAWNPGDVITFLTPEENAGILSGTLGEPIPDRPGERRVNIENQPAGGENAFTGGRTQANGMIYIPFSNEQSRAQHVVTLWANFNNGQFGWTQEVGGQYRVLDAAYEAGGLAIIAHPGRYTGGLAGGAVGEAASNNPQTVRRYTELFMNHPAALGFELFNRLDNETRSDRILWDNVLSNTMPRNRPVWAFSNDDSHSMGQAGYNWNVLLMPYLHESYARIALEEGAFYAVTRVDRRLGINVTLPNGLPIPTMGNESTAFMYYQTPPGINRIEVDEDAGTITLTGRDYDRIEWIAGAQGGSGLVIHQGSVLDIHAHWHLIHHNYVRAQLISDYGVAMTQPFGIWDTRQIHPGLIYFEETVQNNAGAPVNTFVFSVNTDVLDIVTGIPNDEMPLLPGGRQATSLQAQAAVANGLNVLAAVNADFFYITDNTRIQPVGVTIRDGHMLTPFYGDYSYPRGFFGVKRDGTPVIGRRAFFDTVYTELYQAVGGGDMLVYNGYIYSTFLHPGIDADRHPRTAVGITADNEVLLVVADGRSAVSHGFSMAELATYMYNLGAVWAVNLDGGGSTTAVLQNAYDGFLDIINVPSDGVERTVANSILIVDPLVATRGVTLEQDYDGFYLIETAADFIEINRAHTENFRLANDIDLDGGFISPVHVLAGTFDGAGHTISNLTAITPGTFALFQVLTASGHIKNLNMENVFINTGGNNTAAIAGFSEGLIENVTVTGTIEGATNVGGIAGTLVSTGTIRRSSVRAQITARSQLGGIAGQVTGAAGNTGGIYECFVDINAFLTIQNRAGGIVGFAPGAASTFIDRNIVQGSIEADGFQIGGIGGLLQARASHNIVRDMTLTANNTTTLAGSGNVAGLLAGWVNIGAHTHNVIKSGAIYTSAAAQGHRIGFHDAGKYMNFVYEGVTVNGSAQTGGLHNNRIGADATAAQLEYKGFFVQLGFDFYDVFEWNDSTNSISLRGVEMFENHAPSVYYYVTFLDWDGRMLAFRRVTPGTAVTLPPQPTRAGYMFIGWDTDLSAITGDLTVRALYEPIVDGIALIRDTDGYFLIQTAADFAQINNGMAANFRLANDIDFTDFEIALIPRFAGTFDGNGNTIFNLTQDRASDAGGLFLELAAGGHIHNLRMENVDIRSVATNTSGLVGVNRGLIENVLVTGRVSGTNNVGGIAGEHNVTTGHISRVSVDIAIEGTQHVGGIVGVMTGVSNGGGIERSFANVDAHLIGGLRVGGIVGHAPSSTASFVENNIVQGSVSGTGTSVGGIGGLLQVRASHNIVQNMAVIAQNTTTNNNVTGLMAGWVNGGPHNNNVIKSGGIIGHYNVEANRIGFHDAGKTNNFVNQAVVINGLPQAGGAHNNRIGADATATQLATKAFYVNLGFDFTDVFYWDEATSTISLRGVEVRPASQNTVTFLNWDNTVISTQTVALNAAATAPVIVPEKDYFVFIGWNLDFSRVTANMTVMAMFEPYLDSGNLDRDTDGFYLIRTGADFTAIIATPNQNFRLANDIDLANYEGLVIPIFGGTFDGDGNTLSNLTQTRGSALGGLFTELAASGRIYNLRLQDVYVRSTASAGGLVALSRGLIENVTVTGQVFGGTNVGGVVGRLDVATGHIRRVSVTAEVSATGNQVGGIAGDFFGNANHERGIESSFANVTINSSGTRAAGIVGAVAAITYAVVQNNIAEGHITTTGITPGGIGGLLQARVYNNIVRNMTIVANSTGTASNAAGLLGGWTTDARSAYDGNVIQSGAIITSAQATGNRISFQATNKNNNFASVAVTIDGQPQTGGTHYNHIGADATIQQLSSREFYEELGFDFDNVFYWNTSVNNLTLRGVEMPLPAPWPAQPPNADAEITAAVQEIEGTAFLAVTQATLNDEPDAVTHVEGIIAALNLAGGVTTDVNVVSFTAATEGTEATPVGTNGSLVFTVTVDHAHGTAQTTESLTLTITATYYESTPLTGEATIDNMNPRVGDILTPALLDSNNTGTLTYLWFVNDAEAGSGSTFQVTTAHLGSQISLVITSSAETGSATSEQTSFVLRRQGPAAPVATTYETTYEAAYESDDM
ncbi:MAG: phosphodiester glycosidase family protein [Defluviitaleaceae bacterium]|nr:phosphodiester glycosidase family protein [Defluviitaleaceae bacterium]MCL2262829.1 phosphodiester glycosidase family protein [Defluviitaleaceae bacterium]